MRKRILYVMAFCLLTSLSSYAQEDAHLKDMTKGILQIRKVKTSKDALNKTVAEWSAAKQPKITLMDEIERDTEHEFWGNGANKFKINQVVTYVYSRQNTGMVSKGDYFNSTEKDVLYSAIEKNVKKGETVSYTLTGHAGIQEFVFISYNPKTKFTAIVNGKNANQTEEGVKSIKIGKVSKNDKITFSIRNESSSNESFVISNHNPQK